ncbi:MAG: hypothetical protein NC293_10170 [Roseburia sp.]|nr:hypothetical protein [Roseburia sp.]
MKPEKRIFFIGQQFRVQVRPPNKNQGSEAEGRMVSARILKLYKNFALCRVNESYNECFDYQQLKESREIKIKRNS